MRREPGFSIPFFRSSVPYPSMVGAGPVVLVLLVTLLLPACSRMSADRYPVAGRDAVTGIAEMEDHSGSLPDWLEKGYRGMTVIHVDAHDDLGFIPEEKLAEIRRLAAARDWSGLRKRMDAGQHSLFTLTNYLYAAAQLGVAKEIYWVLPFTFFEEPAGGERARDFLKTAGSVKDPTEVDAMTFTAGCLHGRVRGVLLHVCGADTVPLIKEPVILDVDVDFFPAYASERGLSNLRGLKVFFDLLFGRGYRVAAMNVAYSVNGGYLLPTHRYIGSQVIEALEKPEIIRAGEAPDLWKMRDHADNLLTAGETGLALQAVKEALGRFPEDRPLRAMAAAAEYGSGKIEEALRLGAELCGQDRAACSLLLYLGELGMEKRRFRDAERFFRAALSRDPEWSFGNEKFGIALLDMARAKEALEYLEKAAEKEDDIGLRLRMGDAAFRSGDRALAFRHYDAAKDMFDPRIGLNLTEENVASIDRMIDLYRAAGRADDMAAARAMKRIRGD